VEACKVIAGKNYQVHLYNDYGYVRTETFTSNDDTFSISLDNLPNGNYYINVLDDQGNIVDRKFVIAN
jgi:hypothetical protein